jgi:hypothetical protein
MNTKRIAMCTPNDATQSNGLRRWWMEVSSNKISTRTSCDGAFFGKISPKELLGPAAGSVAPTNGICRSCTLSPLHSPFAKTNKSGHIGIQPRGESRPLALLLYSIPWIMESSTIGKTLRQLKWGEDHSLVGKLIR